MYYSSDEQDTPDMTGKAFKSHLKGAKNWTDEEISLLMDMLEEKLCLWDVFDKEHETGRQRNSLYGDNKFFGHKHRIHQSKN